MTGDDRALSLRPIDYWNMLEDFARFARPDLTDVEAKGLVDAFLAEVTRPGFNPSHERDLVESLDWFGRTFLIRTRRHPDAIARI
jgi:hypothetical protein